MKKALVVGIIVLFLGVSVFSSVSSRSISSPIEMLLEHGVESDDNDIPLEDYKEIISIIGGGGDYVEYDAILWPFLHRLSMANGKFDIYAFTRNPLKLFYYTKATNINTKLFIGIVLGDPDGGASIWGFAIGDITWS